MGGVVRGHPEATARIVEGVITNIGFIGGGAILKGGGEVHGTAAAPRATRSRSRAAFVRGLNGDVIQLARDLGP